jgi:hypothetical protein
MWAKPLSTQERLFSMNTQERKAFLEYIANGVLGRFNSTQTIEEALVICESMNEGRLVKPAGSRSLRLATK